MMAEYIDREALIERLKFKRNNDDWNNSKYRGLECAIAQVKKAPVADVVEVETLKAWLYQIAMNNVGQPIEDMASACEEIANRLDGLRAFARERKK